MLNTSRNKFSVSILRCQFLVYKVCIIRQNILLNSIKYKEQIVGQLRTQTINTIFGKQRVDMLTCHYTKYAIHCHDSLNDKSVQITDHLNLFILFKNHTSYGFDNYYRSVKRMSILLKIDARHKDSLRSRISWLVRHRLLAVQLGLEGRGPDNHVRMYDGSDHPPNYATMQLTTKPP